jgi:hypothetical protein
MLAIDGEQAADALARIEGLISAATPTWLRHVALHELAGGFPGESAELLVQPVSGAPPFTVEVAYDAPWDGIAGGANSPEEPRPERIEEILPGIWYVDLTRINFPDYFGALPDLAAADGVIFDLRGYPFRNAPFDVVFHISDRRRDGRGAGANRPLPGPVRSVFRASRVAGRGEFHGTGRRAVRAGRAPG